MKTKSLLLSVLLLPCLLKSQVTPCAFYCSDPMSDGCFFCDVNDIAGDYPFTLMLESNPDDADPTCNGGDTNTSWFVFVAASNEISLEISATTCYGLEGGLQVGIRDGCGGACLDLSLIHI